LEREVTMTLRFTRPVLICFAMGCLFGTVVGQKPVPNPVLVFIGQQPFESGGKEFTRYRFSVHNRADFPDELFAAAPELPPCGTNKNASRTWLDIFDQRGKRLNGFCALSKQGDLDGIWFALEKDVIPPSWVYIELSDRKTGSKYRSNLAETSL